MMLIVSFSHYIFIYSLVFIAIVKYSKERVLKLTVADPDGSLEVYTFVPQEVAPPCCSASGPHSREGSYEITS